MTRFLSLIALIVVVSPAAADSAGDLKAMQGEWKAQKARRSGKDAPAEIIDKLRLKVDGTKFTIEDGSAREERAEVTLDGSKTPGTIDIAPVGEGKEVVKGIYKIDGDTLTMSWTKGGDRPTDFKAEESNAILMVFQRVKK